MKLAVVGSRSFGDFAGLCAILDALKPSAIISGGARGADSLAHRYAIERGLMFSAFLPDWKRHGRSAGFRRNAQIVEAADQVVAFWDGLSAGTAHSIGLARKLGKPVLVVRFVRNESEDKRDGVGG